MVNFGLDPQNDPKPPILLIFKKISNLGGIPTFEKTHPAPKPQLARPSPGQRSDSQELTLFICVDDILGELFINCNT